MEAVFKIAVFEMISLVFDFCNWYGSNGSLASYSYSTFPCIEANQNDAINIFSNA